MLPANAQISFAVQGCSADVFWLDDCQLQVRGGCLARYFHSAQSPSKAVKVLRVGPVFRRVPVALLVIVGDLIAIAIVRLLIELQRLCEVKA